MMEQWRTLGLGVACIDMSRLQVNLLPKFLLSLDRAAGTKFGVLRRFRVVSGREATCHLVKQFAGCFVYGCGWRYSCTLWPFWSFCFCSKTRFLVTTLCCAPVGVLVVHVQDDQVFIQACSQTGTLHLSSWEHTKFDEGIALLPVASLESDSQGIRIVTSQ